MPTATASAPPVCIGKPLLVVLECELALELLKVLVFVATVVTVLVLVLAWDVTAGGGGGGGDWDKDVPALLETIAVVDDVVVTVAIVTEGAPGGPDCGGEEYVRGIETPMLVLFPPVGVAVLSAHVVFVLGPE